MATPATDVLQSPLIRYCRWSLAVTVAATPYYVWRFKLIVPTTVLEVLVLITICLYVAARVQARDWRVPRSPVEIPAALLLIAGLIGVVVSPDHVGALGIYRAYFIEPIALFYVAIDLMRTPQQIRVVLLGLAIGSTVFAIFNLGAWAQALLAHKTIETGNAPEAWYSSPNAVAMFLEPPLAIASGFILYADDRRDRHVAIGCMVFLLPAVLATLSRAAWLTVAVLALVAVITLPQTRLKLAVLAAALIGALAMTRVPYVAIRLAHQLDPSKRDNTLEGRLRIWSDTWHMLKDHPLFGAGLRAYSRVMKPYVTGGREPELYPHDVYLAIWSELGLLGLVAFVALVGVLLWLAWRAYSLATGFYRPLTWGAAAAMVTIVVHGIFDTPIFKNDLAIEFWMVAAYAVVGAVAVRTGNGASDRNPAVRALS
jgi:putative inorganic carbon (hco3(-)) transporter